MKRLIVLIVLVAFAAAVGYASLSKPVTKKKAVKDMQQTEKKVEKKKKECKRSCWFS